MMDERPQSEGNTFKNVIRPIGNGGEDKKSTLEAKQIKLNNFTAKWSPDAPAPTLNALNITVPDGELLAVIGQVGAGKVRHFYTLFTWQPKNNFHGNLKIISTAT
jgi:ABC-type bacteriocin/lantibiotic exporter with double-glycine peptidase domain